MHIIKRSAVYSKWNDAHKKWCEYEMCEEEIRIRIIEIEIWIRIDVWIDIKIDIK
jgi:hypothetical protein